MRSGRRTPRVRMFAGPNGSGKSRLKEVVDPEWIGVYVNADELEKQLTSEGIELALFEVKKIESYMGILRCHLEARSLDEIGVFRLKKGHLFFAGTKLNSYYAACVASALREYLLKSKVSFSFETVMSHKSKVEFMQMAKLAGFRTYLYFIATKDPEININRVALRVSKGGHDVPKDKVVERYKRSLFLLKEAVKSVDRGFIFDNSGEISMWLAESIEGKTLILRNSSIPVWLVRSLELDLENESVLVRKHRNERAH